MRWRVTFRKAPNADLCLVIRVDQSNQTIRDYYVLPTAELRHVKGSALFTDHPVFAEAYRYDNLEAFYRACGPR